MGRSILEAYIVAVGAAIRHEGIPTLDMWGVLSPGHGPLEFHEENEDTIPGATTGKSPTTRNLRRPHAVSVPYLHELFQRPVYQPQHEHLERQTAVVYTKAFGNGVIRDHVACPIDARDFSTMTVAAEIHVLATPSDQACHPWTGSSDC